MGGTQKIEGMMAFTSRLLDDDIEGRQPLHRTTTKNKQYNRRRMNHKNRSELHLTHQGTYYSEHSLHNHISSGTPLVRDKSAGTG
jgi:hypothetical protein